MAPVLVPGQREWSCTRDEDGHREYKIVHLVRSAYTDGPANVLQTPGLPFPGSWWLVDGDVDIWAWCRANATVTPLVTNEPNNHFLVESTFSTRPPSFERGSEQRPDDIQIEDPLLEPQKISGEFDSIREEQIYDRFGVAITNSAWERLKGPQVEFDVSRPKVRIEQNRAALELPLLAQFANTVNAAPLWGLPARTVKLSHISWARQFYGPGIPYYTRSFDFDIDYNTWDRNLLDEGTKVLQGDWGAGTGTGCTINITAVDNSGGITAVSLGAGGSNYAKSSIFDLTVLQEDASRGVVTVISDKDGVVIELTGDPVEVAGSGYLPANGLATIRDSRWVLRKVDGKKPNRKNPQHFIHFKDFYGENSTVVLNGGGLPAINGLLPGFRVTQFYRESDFLQLGIPTTL